MHPRLQARLADYFIETMKRPDGSGSQWVIETHSETLVLRILRRIRAGTLRPEDVSIIYINKPTESGAATKSLRISDRGIFLDRWPDGFFEDGYNEINGD